MKHIHFVIYRLKSIFVILFFLFYFFIICIYSEIEFIKPLDDIKIQRKTITFTKDYESRTIFIKKKISSGIMRMFIYFIISIFIYSILLAKCYAFAQIIIVFLVRNIFFFYSHNFFFFFLKNFFLKLHFKLKQKGCP
jgi:hypothetical protein